MRAPIVKYSCPRRWESLAGAGDRRFCDGCGEHVHDLSAMEPRAAERFVAEHPGACLRFAADGRGRVVFRSRRLAVVATAAALAGCAGWDESAELASPVDEAVGWDDRSAVVPDREVIESTDAARPGGAARASTTPSADTTVPDETRTPDETMTPAESMPAFPSADERAREASEAAEELAARRPGFDRAVSKRELRRYRRAQRRRGTVMYVTVGR